MYYNPLSVCSLHMLVATLIGTPADPQATAGKNMGPKIKKHFMLVFFVICAASF